MLIKNYMKYNHKDCIFYIKKSNVCNGLGLFAKKNIKKGTYITYYYGYITRPFKTSKKNKYSIEYSGKRIKNLVLVGIKNVLKLKFKGAAQLANDSICWDITKKENNSIFIQKGKHVLLKSKQDIKKGDEILVSYGIKYWINQINMFQYEYNDDFKFTLNIINYLIQIAEQCIKTEIYEYLGLYKNVIKFDLMENKRWCIYSHKYHENNNFYLLLEKDDNKINIYYKCITCLSKSVFIESIFLI
jgi:hypothetical protein